MLVGDGQGSLECCSPWGCKESDMTEQLNNNRIKNGFPQWFRSKETTYNAGAAGDVGSIPGSGRSPGLQEWHNNPFQYSCPENLMDRGDWKATVHRVAKSQKQRSDLV